MKNEPLTLASQTRAQQVTRSGGFDLLCSANTAFPLFSPEGERLWIKAWNPRPVFPDTIAFAPDTVFREGEANDEAVWTILDADWQRHRAEYVRLAPTSHTAHIVVKIEEQASDRCHVVVHYTVTALEDHATTLVESFSELAYAEKMRAWQRQITAYLAGVRSV
jgi:hypothetical protein